MKFKVGDKIKHKEFGIGEIIGFDVYDNQYAVVFENEHKGMYNFSLTYREAGLDKPLDRKIGRWCYDNVLELVEKN